MTIDTIESWAIGEDDVVLMLRKRGERKIYRHLCRIQSVHRAMAVAFIRPEFEGVGYVVLPGHTERGIAPQIVSGHTLGVKPKDIRW